jgi:DNA-binding winged helix-turn-helix (wHTH) protein
MIICFSDDYELDVERRELKRAQLPIHVEPQVFDLLVYLVQNRDRVVSKDDIFASVWAGRIVSDSTVTSRINAVRTAVGDNGDDQNARLRRNRPKSRPSQANIKSLSKRDGRVWDIVPVTTSL